MQQHLGEGGEGWNSAYLFLLQRNLDYVKVFIKFIHLVDVFLLHACSSHAEATIFYIFKYELA